MKQSVFVIGTMMLFVCLTELAFKTKLLGLLLNESLRLSFCLASSYSHLYIPFLMFRLVISMCATFMSSIYLDIWLFYLLTYCT